MEAALAEWGEPRLVVPPTPSGMATALTQLGAVNRGSDPWGVEATERRGLPRVELGDDPDAPHAPRDPAVLVEAPRRFDALFVLAPLAHYLGATVTTASREAPRIRVPGMGIERDLPSLPALQDAVADLLDRVVGFDRLAIDGGERAREAFDAAGLDRGRIASATPDERLAAYLDDAGGVDPGVAGYDLAMYVDPSPEHVPALSHLLERECTIHLPEAAPVGRDELLRRSLEDFYRASQFPEVDVDLVSPTRRRGSIRGWLADGVAVDAFKATTTAYENRTARTDPDERRVTVVLNDPDMQAEGSEVERIYRERAASLGMDVSVERGLGRAELAAALDRPASFLHYVGHCDESGLRCVDGHLAIEEIERSGARTFLLNACGSYHEGRELVRKGSVAGAVTLGPVLDAQAAKVGVAFAGLVTRGFCIERALRIARRRAIMNKDYVVVGDGTYSLPGETATGGHIERLDGGRFRIFLDDGDDGIPVTTTRPELLSYLRRIDADVVYSGRRQSARAVYRRLANAPFTK